MLGFRGHFVTKSRGYSTKTLERCAPPAPPTAPTRTSRPEDGEVDDDESTVVLSASATSREADE
jgi:hypothetical protein